MFHATSVIVRFLVVVWLFHAGLVSAADRLQPLTVGYSIELKDIYAGRLRPQQLLVSGDVPIVVATGSGALTSHALGAKDQVLVAINMNKVGGGIFAKSEIKTPEDLRGKIIGVSSAGSISEVILRYGYARNWAFNRTVTSRCWWSATPRLGCKPWSVASSTRLP
jgi:ABC-type nitrate/sulfonate/bicarbonate transport system substrate-binding protein